MDRFLPVRRPRDRTPVKGSSPCPRSNGDLVSLLPQGDSACEPCIFQCQKKRRGHCENESYNPNLVWGKLKVGDPANALLFTPHESHSMSFLNECRGQGPSLFRRASGLNAEGS